ncbi:MAG: hypothetical protein WA159_20805 [Variovorax sp.]
MDVADIFKNEVFRPVVVTVIPGATALVPYLFLIDHYFPGFVALRTGNEIIAFTLMTLAIIATGMVLEDVGSNIEMKIWARITRNSTAEQKEWETYLRTHFEKPPAGVEYLRDIVMRMKFENSFAPALLLMSLGLMLLWWMGYVRSGCPIWVAIAVAVVLAFYLVRESFKGAKLLISVRRQIITSVNIPSP